MLNGLNQKYTEQLTLQGHAGVQTRLYEVSDLMKIVKLQRAVRLYLNAKYQRTFAEDYNRQNGSMLAH